MSAVAAPRFSCQPMLESDLDAVTEAENNLYPFPWTRANFADSLAAGYSAWLCRRGPDLIGYAVMMLVLDEAHLLNLSVCREWQGQRYGLGLLEFLFSVAQESGATRMFLEVRPSNGRAIRLYRRRGFQTIGIRRGYYPAERGREDALVMALDL